MKKLSKLLIMCLAVLMLVGTFATSASAAWTNTRSMSGSSRFKSDWEKTTTYKVGTTTIGKMIYGYDTAWINEDYVWTKGYECETTAKVKRMYYDNSYISDSKAAKNKYSKIEVTHKTYYVLYQIKFEATYGNVTYSTATSSVK